MLTGTQTFILLMKAGALDKNQHENLEKFLLEQDAEIARLRAERDAVQGKLDFAEETIYLLEYDAKNIEMEEEKRYKRLWVTLDDLDAVTAEWEKEIAGRITAEAERDAALNALQFYAGALYSGNTDGTGCAFGRHQGQDVWDQGEIAATAIHAMTAKRDSALEANASLISALALIREKDLRVGGRTSDGVYHVDGELGRIAAAAIHAIIKQEDKG